MEIGEVQMQFAELIWKKEPIASGELVKLFADEFGWKKSTTYTILRKLVSKGMAQNEDAVVTVLVERDRVQRYESSRVVKRNFGGSLPSFITAFLGDKTLTASEADELKELIDSYRDDK